MLVVVLYLGFTGEDGDAKKDDPTAQGKKAKAKHKRKGKRDKARVTESGGVGVGKMCAKIDCSEAQLASFKSMVKEHRKNTSRQRRGLAEAHAKIAAELAEDRLDTDALDEAFEDATTHRSEMNNSARGVLEAIHTKLSAAQREGLAKMVARHGPSVLLSRPSTGSKKSKKPRSKKRRRKSGLTLRSASAHREAVVDSGTEPVADASEEDSQPPTTDAAAPLQPAERDEPADTRELEMPAAQ